MSLRQIYFWLIVFCLAMASLGQDTPQTRMRPIDAWQPQADRVDWSTVRHVSLERLQDGRLWRFDQPSPVHLSAVRVSIGSQGGSGTIIGTTGQAVVVLTNHHVAETGGRCAMTLQCTMLDGTKFSGKYIGAHQPLDLAAYLVERSDLPSIAVSSENVPLGESVTVMSFGGPNHHKATFRPFVAPVIKGHATVAVDAGTISGDSGSGMVWRGVLVGVNFGMVGGYSVQERGWPVHYPSSSWADAKAINGFLTQCLDPYGCQPRVSPPGQSGGSGGGSPFYPPSYTPPQITPPQSPTQPITPPQYTPPQPPPAVCPPPITKDEIKELIAQQLGEMELRGPRGERGEPGPSGKDGRDGKDGEVQPEHLQAIVDAVLQNLPNSPPVATNPPAHGDTVDLDALADLVIAKLPPISLSLVDPQGKELDRDTVRLGGTLRLQLSPKKSQTP